MPASTRLINGRWRVVEPGGRPVTNRKGTAVDGGGHATKKAAQQQAAAINISQHKRKK